MKTTDESLMKLPIHQLEVSAEFIEQTEQFGFQCLDDIVAIGWARLLQMEHFSYRWFNELVSFLEPRQLLYLLEKPKAAKLFAAGHH